MGNSGFWPLSLGMNQGQKNSHYLFRPGFSQLLLLGLQMTFCKGLGVGADNRSQEDGPQAVPARPDQHHLPRLSLYTSPDQSPGAKHLAEQNRLRNSPLPAHLDIWAPDGVHPHL